MSSQDVPSNAELAERTARIEMRVEHIQETVDRIEIALSEQQEEIAEDVEENSDRVETLWAGYRISRWVVPIGVALGGALGSLASGGFI